MSSKSRRAAASITFSKAVSRKTNNLSTAQKTMLFRNSSRAPTLARVHSTVRCDCRQIARTQLSRTVTMARQSSQYAFSRK